VHSKTYGTAGSSRDMTSYHRLHKECSRGRQRGTPCRHWASSLREPTGRCAAPAVASRLGVQWRPDVPIL
jgi:hypothetical protein